MIDYIIVDKTKFKDTIKAYWLWKELNILVKTIHNRGINFPESISETILCYTLDYQLIKGTSGDARDPTTNKIIEIKSSSNFDKDTSSFSPSHRYDNLFFVRLMQENDIAYIYNLNRSSKDIEKIKVNKIQTVKDQQVQGRRPRFSIIKKIIEPNNLKPIIIVDFRLKKIIKK